MQIVQWQVRPNCTHTNTTKRQYSQQGIRAGTTSVTEACCVVTNDVTQPMAYQNPTYGNILKSTIESNLN
jgi:hypothetical protein